MYFYAIRRVFRYRAETWHIGDGTEGERGLWAYFQSDPIKKEEETEWGAVPLTP